MLQPIKIEKLAPEETSSGDLGYIQKLETILKNIMYGPKKPDTIELDQKHKKVRIAESCGNIVTIFLNVSDEQFKGYKYTIENNNLQPGNKIKLICAEFTVPETGRTTRLVLEGTIVDVEDRYITYEYRRSIKQILNTFGEEI